MFCPNCGTQNESAATQCKNCGFKLTGLSTSKFKGTMMLNTDQTVQDLIDAHKKKQAAGSSAEEQSGTAEKERPSSSRISSYPGAPKSVLQPPRASSRRRMAGTMMGVAPQVGGFAPPAGNDARTPEPGASQSSRDSTTPAPGGAHEPPSSEPGSERRPRSTPPPAPVGTPPAPTAVSPRPDPGTSSDATAEAEPSANPRIAPTAAMPAIAEHESASARSRLASDAGSPPSPELTRDSSAPQEPRGTAATVSMAARAESPLARGELSARPRLVRPLEVVLILATCGLYGLVLLFKQRRQRERSDSSHVES